MTQAASPARASPANTETASGRKNFMVLERATRGSVNIDVRGTRRRGMSPTRSTRPGPVALRATASARAKAVSAKKVR